MTHLRFFYVLLLACLQLGALAAPFSLFRNLYRRDDACNGDSALCGRKYSNVSFIGTHDSPFVGPLPSQNQDKSVSDQLASGIRFLQSQIHPILGVPFMCHTHCMLENAGTVERYLKTVKTWLDANPREVVTLLMTNPERMDMSKFANVFKKVGADKLAFVPAKGEGPFQPQDWPTLGDMISSGKRLVVFVDYNTNEQNVPYLLDQFSYFFEGPYNTIDPEFKQCDMDRRNKVDNEGSNSMYLVNHYLNMKVGDMLVPDRLSASQVNAADGASGIGTQVQRCIQQWGRPPNVILVDFFGSGDELNAQRSINNL